MSREKRSTGKKERSSVRQSFSLTLFYAAFTFLVLLLSIGCAILTIKLFIHYDVLMHVPQEFIPDVNQTLAFIVLVSLVVGALLSIPVVQFQLFPLKRLIHEMNRLASGDFHARIHFRKIITLMPSYAEMETSFNQMATELESTEMLRSDFVNNFSHEFKTPIVSIAGFARLLQKGQLDEQQQKEYLSAIAEESMRLSHMATSVLNLTRLENQSSLTDVTRYNVSEQIRACILLLENTWNEKNIEWSLDFEEYEIDANEEQLKEVWINLLDNAIKFSPREETIELTACIRKSMLQVTISNRGEIPEDTLPRIWHKFYQGDESHSSAGNGIGLAIVRRIAELHGGSVSAENDSGWVRFTVTLPVNH